MISSCPFAVDMYLNSADEENQEDLISFNDDPASKLPSKHDIISSLAVGGRWVTSQSDLQVGSKIVPRNNLLAVN